ncbi:single-stranded DNA-binding protein [Pseudonocardia sp. KRD291]|uniref:single-stranded DNA-binding protein n=1 Tax=Pseudonocardia sp. KRD291 TaxID=2792007 RepID=UPI001C49ED27|nr:single-stranded DNA-binding protein [Pseudonocardia sp. KRD291]MBW0106579.1 single-stranded DNA-binding protein [Pseudonocardia sp. KRD291]
MRTLITVSGNLTNQPVSRSTKDGVQVVEFGLACNSRRQDRSTGLWEDGEASFFTVTCWRKLAENVLDSLHRGDPVLVHARFSTREYTRADGTLRSELKLEAQSVGPDLGRSRAIVRRTTRPAVDATDASPVVADGGADVPEPRAGEGEEARSYRGEEAELADSRPLVAVPAADA